MPQFMPILRKGRFRLSGRQQLCAAHLGPESRPPAQGDEELADQIEAQCQEDLNQEPNNTSQDDPAEMSEESPPGPPMPVTAHIVEQTDGIAVIEVTCHCGEVIHIQCFVGNNSPQPADNEMAEPPQQGPQGDPPGPAGPPAGLSTHPPTAQQAAPSVPEQPQHPPAETEPAGGDESDPFNFTPPEIQDENDA